MGHGFSKNMATVCDVNVPLELAMGTPPKTVFRIITISSQGSVLKGDIGHAVEPA